ncbi:hypothetical protein PCANB_001946, partial [Pneumocystis canis]
LEPLKMRPPQTITNTETFTSTVTQNVTVDSQGKTICTSDAPLINMNCTSIRTTDTWITHTSTHTNTMTKTSTITSKVTIVSTKKCQPTQCTTDRTYPTQSSEGEEEEVVKLSGGMRIHGWGTIQYTPESTLPNKAYLHMTKSTRWVNIDLGREGVQMLKKRDQEGKGEVIGEDELLALILKEHAMTDNCEKKLNEYCENLKKAELKFENIHNKLKEYCNENGKVKNGKCKELKEKIQGKCTKFKNELEKAPKEKPVKNENCVKYELQCLFLEGACSDDLTEKCSEVRNECYETKRNKVADEIALRALKGELKKETKDQCEEKLKEHCPILGRMSQELMEKCLDSEKACQSLITEAGKKCASLKDKVKDELKGIKDNTCKTLLEECHFYGPNCEEDEIKTNCGKRKKECEEKDIIYTPPEEPWFPIQPRVSIIEEVGLEELYKTIAQGGILINKLRHPSMEDLLFFLSQKNGDEEFNEEECKEAHKTERCNYLKALSKNSDYDCDKLKDKCNELKKEFKKEQENLKKEIKNVGLLNKNNGPGKAEIIPWHKLYSDFYGKRCAELQSDCFFLSRYNNDLKTACDNVQAMCYRRGLDAAAYETLEDQMRGEFQDLGQNNYQCQKKLVEVCDKVKNRNHILLSLCSDPEDTCFSLSHDIRAKTYELDHILGFTRDFPEEHDCLELEPKCNRLKEEDTRLLGPCHTLERNCHHLRESKQLRDLLLGEKKNLSDIKYCTEKVNDKCHYYSRKLYKQFELSCALQNDTCTIMSFHINLHCENLKENINKKEIITKLSDAKDKMDQLRELCPLWVPYCDTLLPNCANKLADEGKNDTLCPKIQEICKPYQTRQALEDAVFYEFRGNLTNTNTCNTRLKEHCATWTQKENTFSSLCNDTNDSKKSDKVKEELCQRLVDRVKKLCKKLPDKLKEEEKELTRRIEVYNDLKNKTENATKGTNVILTFSIENNSTNKTNNSTGKTNSTISHELVKRSQSHPTITETEAHAFDLVAMVITEYVELKEKCRKLLLDCGFEEECPSSKTPCKDIKKKCGELKPLEMKPPQTITNTETSTSTVTQNVTVDSEGKPICTSGTPSINMNCTSIHTTDTWVTHTSTHTNTMTKTSTVTSKITIVSTKKCQPTQCTTDRTHPTHGSGGEEAGDVKPSGGIRVNGWGTAAVIDTCKMIILSSRDEAHSKTLSPRDHRWVNIDLGREGVQMLKKRDQGVLEGMEEEHFLALILKEDAINGRCKDKLGNYCKALYAAGLESGKVHDKLKDICENGNVKDEDNKCKELETKIQDKCTELKNGLDKVFSERPVKSSNCTQYEPQCLFLGECSDEVIEKCSELRNECYEIKRNEVAEEIALRALKGSLKKKENENEEKCIEDLKKHCPILGKMSRELMEKCLDPKGACKDFKRMAEEKCDSLKKEVKKALENVNDKTCLPLLEECHFYGPNCEEKNEIQKNCEKLKTKCEDKHDIVYTPPEEPWFPIQPRVSIIEEVGLEGLYKAVAQEGLLINKLKLPSMEDLIFFLSQENKKNDFDENKCKEINKDNCDYLRTLSKNSDYDCTNIKDDCGQLEVKFKKRRKALKEDIQAINLLNKNNDPGNNAETIPWHKLDSDFNGENCAELESECFYLDKNGKSDFAKACQNIENMCYKKGIDAVAYETLESRMRGEFRDSGQNWLNQCQGKLINVCEKVKTQSHDLFALCLEPKETCKLLNWDIQTKVHKLNRILDFKRDFPEEDHCLELEPKCDRLKKEDTFLLGPCHTLEKNCRHLRESQQLRDLLLGEKKNLSDITHCGDKVNDKCHHYSRKIDKQFKLSCALQNNTCKMISFYIKKYCSNLQENIKGKKIVKQLIDAKGNMDKLRKLCPSWVPYCDALLPSCPKLKGNDTVKLCREIQTYCKPYQTRQALEDAVLYEFRGNLTNINTCNTTLKEHCATWTQKEN